MRPEGLIMPKMRGSFGVGLIAVALASLVAAVTPVDAGRNHERVEIGSILIEAQGPSNLAPLVGLALVSNEGLEKIITYPLPQFTTSDTRVVIPLFVMRLNVNDDDGSAPTIRELDSFLFLTNSNAGNGPGLPLRITFRRADGSPVVATGNAMGNPLNVTIAPGQTVVISAASAINP
jgi:hypothetical protein